MAERFLQAYGLGHLLRDPRFQSNEARVQHVDQLDAEIAAAIRSRTLEENCRIIEEHALTAVAVQTVADIERDPHWQARHLLVDVPAPSGVEGANGHSTVRMHNVVPRLSETPGTIAWPGGALGEHNHDLFGTELGLSCDEMKSLQRAGVI